jgi:hypothetical protein
MFVRERRHNQWLFLLRLRYCYDDALGKPIFIVLPIHATMS